MSIVIIIDERHNGGSAGYLLNFRFGEIIHVMCNTSFKLDAQKAHHKVNHTNSAALLYTWSSPPFFIIFGNHVTSSKQALAAFFTKTDSKFF